MKSTIKSAFAILAVALMIMAAVVPMVGVFSQEDSSAATTGTLVDEEYNDTIANPIKISGKIYKADGTTAIENAKVIVKWDGKSLSGLTTAAGVYTVTTDVKITDVITKVEVSVDTTSEYVNGITKNPALGMAFPTVTLDNVNKTHDAAGGNAVDIISGTALVKGQIQTKEGEDISLAGVTISGAEGTVVTKAYSATVKAGSFEFYGKVGTAYTISASAIDTTFAYYGAGTEATSYTVTTANNQEIVLKARDNILTITNLSVPFITSITKLAPSEGKKDTITALGTPVIGKDTVYKAYAKITFNTATSAAAADFEQTKFVLDYFTSVARSAVNTTGVTTTVVDTLYKVVPKDLVIAAAALTGETLAYAVYDGNVYMDAGHATKVTPSAVNLSGTYTDTTAIPKTTAAKIVDGTFYVGNVVAYNADGTAKTIYDAGAKILPTFAGYTFTETAAAAGMQFVAQNAFLFTGKVSALPTGVAKATISVTATNYVAVKLTVTPGAEANRTYSFYVPQNTSVTVKAPTDAYNPSQYVNDNSIDALTKTITIPEFVYDVTTENVTYTGIITLNDVPISFAAAAPANYIAISVDGGKSFATNVYAVTFNAYNVYEFTVPKTIPESDIFVKIAQAYEESAVAGVSGYAFAYEWMEPAVTDAGYYYSFYSVTNTEVEEIAVKEAKIKATITDAAELEIPGQEVDFYMVNSGAASFAAATVKIELGSAVTDLDGVASIKAGKTVADGGYMIVAIPDDESIYGEYTFTWAQEKFAPAYVDKVVVANEVTTYGYVTMKDTKAIVDDPEVSYVAYLGGVKIIGEAVVLNDVYYIITPTTYNIDVYVDGYEFNDNYYVTILAAATGAQVDLVNAEIALPIIIPVITYDIITVGEYAGLINVSAIEAAEGDVITVSAPSSYIEADDETIYTDAYVKYTFAGWYVNGVLLSKDCNTSFIMVDDDAAVSCDYTVEYIKTSDVNDPQIEPQPVPPAPEVKEQGIDTNVLIIGICAVVIALIAVVYAVIKRN